MTLQNNKSLWQENNALDLKTLTLTTNTGCFPPNTHQEKFGLQKVKK